MKSTTVLLCAVAAAAFPMEDMMLAEDVPGLEHHAARVCDCGRRYRSDYPVYRLSDRVRDFPLLRHGGLWSAGVRSPSIGHLVAAGQGPLWAAGGELPRGVRWVAAGRRGDDSIDQPNANDDQAKLKPMDKPSSDDDQAKLKPMDKPSSADPSLMSKKGDN